MYNRKTVNISEESNANLIWSAGIFCVTVNCYLSRLFFKRCIRYQNLILFALSLFFFTFGEKMGQVICTIKRS